jgi:hypothetical protein
VRVSARERHERSLLALRSTRLHNDAVRCAVGCQLAPLPPRVDFNLVHRRQHGRALRQLLQVRDGEVGDADVGDQPLGQAALERAPGVAAQEGLAWRVEEHQVDVAQLLQAAQGRSALVCMHVRKRVRWVAPGFDGLAAGVEAPGGLPHLRSSGAARVTWQRAGEHAAARSLAHALVVMNTRSPACAASKAATARPTSASLPYTCAVA